MNENCFSNPTFIAGIFTIIGGIIGAFAGGIIAWLISNLTLKKQIFISGSNDFKVEFNEALERLSPTYQQNASGIVKEFYGRHEIAKDKFVPYLRTFKGNRAVSEFNKTWKAYCDKENTNNRPWIVYNTDDNTSETVNEMKSIVKKKILDLFEFTKI